MTEREFEAEIAALNAAFDRAYDEDDRARIDELLSFVRRASRWHARMRKFYGVMKWLSLTCCAASFATFFTTRDVAGQALLVIWPALAVTVIVSLLTEPLAKRFRPKPPL